MDVAYISALSALPGSVIGGVTSTGTTCLSPRAQTRSGDLIQVGAGIDPLKDFSEAAREEVGISSFT